MLKVVNNKVTMTRGDTCSFYCRINHSDEDKTPYELQDGDVLVFTLRETAKTDSPTGYTLQKTFSDYQITLTPSDTESLSYGNYVYDVQLTLADGTVNTIIPINMFVLCEEVT